MKILVGGSGKMAKALAKACDEKQTKYYYSKPALETLTSKNRVILIYFGSKKSWPTYFEKAKKGKWPIIMCSTDVPDPNTKELTAPYVKAPNTALLILRLLSVLPRIHEAMEGSTITLQESHQYTKTSTPGTAKLMAEICGIQKIESVRNKGVQLELGIPLDHLDWHASHRLTFEHEGVSVQIVTTIYGGMPYAYGALALAKLIAEKHPTVGIMNAHALLQGVALPKTEPIVLNEYDFNEYDPVTSPPYLAN